MVLIYKREKLICEKVILVTHSMGGLVARHCSEVLGMSEKILGIVHGVMPTIGAAAVYRRFKSGTEGARIASEVLGNDAAEMTAVLSSAPGPTQLLPTAAYGNGWLRIKELKGEIGLPKLGDPYAEIYTVRGKWWSMCEDFRINPMTMNISHDAREKHVDANWDSYADIIFAKVKPFHLEISGKYHSTTHAFFGSDPAFKSYGNVTWTGTDETVNDLLLRNNRDTDFLNAKSVSREEIRMIRTVKAQLAGEGWKKDQKQVYVISGPDEDGDGTVPQRSGIAPKDSPKVKSLLKVRVGHEPAFKDSEVAKQFTLRSIVKIIQLVAHTTLEYK